MSLLCTTAPRTEIKEKSCQAAVEIVESDKEFTLYYELPGLSKKEVTISVEERQLHIKAARSSNTQSSDDEQYCYSERIYGDFSRSFQLPKSVETSGITAEMRQGVLQVTLQKREQELARNISIQ